MRVIAGRLGGRRLRPPPGAGVRPTSDRVREALFAQLGGLDGARVLDLYAGTGALGIEALSRGARSVVFVERAVSSIAVLRANLEDLALCEFARVLRGDALAVVRRLGRAGERFDLVLADPPYAEADAPALLGALAAARLVAPGGTVVCEGSRRHPVPAVAGWRRIAERRYGDTLVTRLEPEAAADESPEGPGAATVPLAGQPRRSGSKRPTEGEGPA